MYTWRLSVKKFGKPKRPKPMGLWRHCTRAMRCARRVRDGRDNPGQGEHLPHHQPHRPPPAPPQSPLAELKSALGPITDASSGLRGDRCRWARRGAEGRGAGKRAGTESSRWRSGPRPPGGQVEGILRVSEAALGSRELQSSLGMARSVGRTVLQLRAESHPRQPQPPEGGGWPPSMPCHQGKRLGPSARPDGAGRRLRRPRPSVRDSCTVDAQS